MHSEYTQYHHHAQWLQAAKKTLNRVVYRGFTIEQKIDGYYVNGLHNYGSLYLAEKAIDDYIDNENAQLNY
jgi:hypothetical protein